MIFSIFNVKTKTRPWRHIYRDIEVSRRKCNDIGIPRLKNHDIEIARLKSHNIEFLWNSDPYSPWQKLTLNARKFTKSVVVYDMVSIGIKFRDVFRTPSNILERDFFEKIVDEDMPLTILPKKLYLRFLTEFLIRL